MKAKGRVVRDHSIFAKPRCDQVRIRRDRTGVRAGRHDGVEASTDPQQPSGGDMIGQQAVARVPAPTTRGVGGHKLRVCKHWMDGEEILRTNQLAISRRHNHQNSDYVSRYIVTIMYRPLLCNAGLVK